MNQNLEQRARTKSDRLMDDFAKRLGERVKRWKKFLRDDYATYRAAGERLKKERPPWADAW